MTATLFSVGEAYSGDPLRPGLDAPTPPEVVAELTPEQRIERVHRLVVQADFIVGDALTQFNKGRTCVARCVLWSGGKDSNTLAHLMRSFASHALMANTTIGIEETRQFVRDSAAQLGLTLVEKVAPISYDELVIDQGFPGPGMHWKMYQRLKERCFDAARHDLGVANSRTKFALFIAGRRRAESDRREDIPLYESDGSVVWCSPLANWTALDLNTYRQMHPDVPHNPVTDLIHMSGECLCGAFAHEGEREEVGEWFPDWLTRIEELEAKVAAAGHPEPVCRWGWGRDWDGPLPKAGRLCGSCATRFDNQTELFGGVA